MVDEADIKAQVEAAINEAANLREQVRDITLKALSQRQLDREAVKQVVQAVTDSVSNLGDQREPIKASLDQALKGVDDALGKTAEAAKLAAQEAMGRTSEFTDTDLKTALQELSTLEDLFFETVRAVAKQSTDVSAEVLNELAGHLKQTGTSVGEQAKSAVDALQADLKNAGRELGVSGAEAGKTLGGQLAQIASGFLAGMSDALQPKEGKGK